MDLQLPQQAHSGGSIPLADAVGALVGIHRCIGTDGAQSVAQLGQVLALDQMFPLFGFDDGVIQVGIDVLHGAKMLDQVQCGFFSNALHAGDVVRSIAHQAFDLDELTGAYAVFLLHSVHVHHHRLAAAHHGRGQQYGSGIAYQLQAVPVSGGQEAVVLPGGTGGGQSAQDIVGLPAFGTDRAVAQQLQKLFEQGHLLGQLLRHTVAVGLVATVHFMTEGGGTQVKGHCDLVRLAFLDQREQNIQKSKHCVGMAAVLGRQQLDAEERPVGNTVAVNDQ